MKDILSGIEKKNMFETIEEAFKERNIGNFNHVIIEPQDQEMDDLISHNMVR